MERIEGKGIVLRKKAAWVIAVVFLVMIGAPGVWRSGSEFMEGRDGWVPGVELFRYSGPTLAGHLREFEARLEGESGFAARSRRWMQAAMTRVFREGNRKTLIGREGWLYYRPELEALTGKGQGPADTIAQYGEQLRGLGVELVLVPIPSKAAVHPAGLVRGERHASIVRKEAGDFYEALRGRGVAVIDPASLYAAAEGGEALYLKQDTHWSPAGVELAAARTAAFLRERPWFGGLAPVEMRFRIEKGEVEGFGDLVGNLGLGDGARALFEKEKVTVSRVLEAETGAEAVLNDEESPIVLLGDSYLNMYRRERMGFGTGASFGDHLAADLGRSLDVIAINGEGATGVRRALAERPDAARSMREKKKVVIWAIAERDLFLPGAAAAGEGVTWQDVAFREGGVDGGGLTLTGTVKMKSRFIGPEGAYKDALFAVEYRVEDVIGGEFEPGVIVVYHWAYRDKVLAEATRFAIGDRKRLKLVPFHEASEELRSVRHKGNDSQEFDAVPYWAEEVMEAE